jgi:hypothetical protein
MKTFNIYLNGKIVKTVNSALLAYEFAIAIECGFSSIKYNSTDHIEYDDCNGVKVSTFEFAN